MNPSDFQRDLLTWYDAHARTLPWRAPMGQRQDPYRVWLSEIMLQQTTVATVGPYFKAFIERWPTIHALAHAPLDDVLSAWAGLGYYSRARNLHKGAQAIVQDFGGAFPDDEATLLTLPGIGPHTAAAIAAIAFDRSAVVIDGNIDRVMTRVHNAPIPIQDNKPAIRAWATALTLKSGLGDYAQALMDLGAQSAAQPAHNACFALWRPIARAHGAGTAADLPTKPFKKAKPTRYGWAYLIHQGDKLLIEKRPPKGLLGGMDGLPSHEWGAERPALLSGALDMGLEVRHTFTHFHLILSLAKGGAELAAIFRSTLC